MTIIVSGGSLVPARKSFPLPVSPSVSRGPSAGIMPLLRGEGLAMTYEGMYRSQPWVYAVVNKLAYGIARLPLKTYTMDADGNRERARGNTLDMLLRKPRPGVSAFERKLNICGSLFIHGHALELKTRSEGPGAVPSELWMVPWKHVQTVEDESGIIGYNIIIGGQTLPVDPSEVIHYSLLNGTSPLEPLRRTLALEDAAMEFQGQNFQNGITPRGAFLTDQRVPREDASRIREELSQMYAGVDNAGRFGILGNGFKWAQMGESAVDAELINQRKLSREEVAAAYDVPPPAIGILDRATFNNISELHKGLYVDSIGPKVALIESAQQAQLIDTELAWDGYFSEFDMNDVLRPDPEARFRAYLMAQQSSTLTVNERRKLENLPALDDPAADTVFIPVNMQPMGMAPLNGTPDSPDSPDDEDDTSDDMDDLLPDGSSIVKDILDRAIGSE